MLPLNQAAANGGLWLLWYCRSPCLGVLYPRAEWRSCALYSSIQLPSMLISWKGQFHSRKL